jgi:uncharacterized protein (TIGR02118 family)
MLSMIVHGRCMKAGSLALSRRSLLGADPRRLSGAVVDRITHGHGRTTIVALHARRVAMIKVSVMYPNGPGARFDQAYYLDKHMPMVKARMGSALRFYSVDKGIAAGSSGDPPTYLFVAHLHCDSVDDFQRAFGPHAPEIMGDIPNYTDQAPVVQISDVLVDKG